MWIGIGVGVLVIGWALDALISCQDAVEDPKTGEIRFKNSKYKGLWDYIKQKWEKGGIR